MAKIIHYFVEGKCEKKLIDVLNVINERISKQRLLVIKPNTHIILVYDTDVENTTILDENIEFLRKHNFKNIYHIQSIKNFEDELVYSTSLRNINQMYNTAGKEEFKNKFIHQTALYSKLKKIDFDCKKIWSRTNNDKPFDKYFKGEDLKFIKTR